MLLRCVTKIKGQLEKLIRKNDMNTNKSTEGQKLVGVTFNPSGDDRVTKYKQACADALDILLKEKEETKNPNALRFFDNAIDSLLAGQMFGVKAQTWKE